MIIMDSQHHITKSFLEKFFTNFLRISQIHMNTEGAGVEINLQGMRRKEQ